MKNALRLIVFILFVAGALIPMNGCQKKTPKDDGAYSFKAEEQPNIAAAVLAMDADGDFNISEADRCPVCAMPVAPNKKSAAAIELKDGTTYYFCSNSCMLKAWLHSEQFLGTGRDNIARAVVTDYFTGLPHNAADVLWVTGSDVIGPMGPALVALANEEDLQTFDERHGAGPTFRLAELDDQLWTRIKSPAAATDTSE